MTGFQVFAGVTSGGAWTGDFAATPISTLTLKQPSAEWGLPNGKRILADDHPPTARFRSSIRCWRT